MGSIWNGHTAADYARAVMMAELGQRREKDPALTLQDVFPFSPDQVADMFLYQSGVEGVWFRLHDGRMFDMHGQPAWEVACYS